MKRKIEFRGFGISDKKWHYGFLTIYESGKNIVGGFEVYPKSVGQYTGLKDKNGKEIYEGDILDITYFLTQNKGIVKFGKYKQCDMSNDYECGNQGFYVDVTNDKHGSYRHDLYFYAGKSEVIGSIFSNPELLQEG